MRRHRSSPVVRACRCAAIALGTTAALVGPATGQAANPGRANALSCEFTVHVRFDGHGSGVSEILAGSPLSKRMSFETDRSSTIDCVGRADQEFITGTGPIVLRATFVAGPLCATRSGTGSVEMDVPRFFPIFTTPMERLAGTFKLSTVDSAWSWRGSVDDERGERTGFFAAARFTPDAGEACTVRSGTLAGRLVVAPGADAGPSVTAPSTR
jgi:hypothetical protein